MQKYLFKLDNIIQDYPWGSKTALTTLFDITNPNNEPQAELWMGMHPNGCSKNAETGELLSDIIHNDLVNCLGNVTASTFKELPFLFKVLCAAEPLSIQVHPSKANAEIGFEKENKLGIDFKAPNRNYKDPNHKPELVYALTEYKAMNGFRPVEQIITLFEKIDLPSLTQPLAQFKAQPNSEGLKVFFEMIMSLSEEQKCVTLKELKLYVSMDKNDETPLLKQAVDYIKHFTQFYPNDIGLLSPLLFNLVELKPGEAMFLYAETPHAYIEGTGLEIMANSDNVLRAGLTPKYIDVPELVANTKFEPILPEHIKMQPNAENEYPIPVDDFNFAIIHLQKQSKNIPLNSAEILFCVEGNITVSSAGKEICLKKGESVFVGYCLGNYQLSGLGIIARAYC